MADFAAAIAVILAHEGGLSEDSADPGGVTNFGISLRWYLSVKPDATADDIRALTKDAAVMLYERYWWNANGYGSIEDQTVATKVFDMAVNMGPPTPTGEAHRGKAHELVQQALGAIGCIGIHVDGILGPLSFGAINQADPTTLLNALISQQVEFYTTLARREPQLAKFLPDWLTRAKWPF